MKPFDYFPFYKNKIRNFEKFIFKSQSQSAPSTSVFIQHNHFNVLFHYWPSCNIEIFSPWWHCWLNISCDSFLWYWSNNFRAILRCIFIVMDTAERIAFWMCHRKRHRQAKIIPLKICLVPACLLPLSCSCR